MGISKNTRFTAGVQGLSTDKWYSQIGWFLSEKNINFVIFKFKKPDSMGQSERKIQLSYALKLKKNRKHDYGMDI